MPDETPPAACQSLAASVSFASNQPCRHPARLQTPPHRHRCRSPLPHPAPSWRTQPRYSKTRRPADAPSPSLESLAASSLPEWCQSTASARPETAPSTTPPGPPHPFPPESRHQSIHNKSPAKYSSSNHHPHCHPEQALFARRRIWASRAKGRVLCDPIIARLARFLISLYSIPHRHPLASATSYHVTQPTCAYLPSSFSPLLSSPKPHKTPTPPKTSAA